ncbi:MAG: hypothetical protein JXR64_05300 [Spirochaetales bacterium]|nr:hypothetical protein [Spirochaetales bacterium]
MKKIEIILLTILITSCDSFVEDKYIPGDLTPPALVSISAISKDSIKIVSNENIFLNSSSFCSNNGLEIIDFIENGHEITIKFNSELTPGNKYSAEYKILDSVGNSLWFIAEIYGYNSNLPKILINEFIVKGTKTNPNKIELYVISSGNMAGITIYNGTKESNDYSFIFPDMDVNEGEYIVIRTTSDNFPIPFIELDNINIKHDKKFLDNVRDIRIDDFKLSASSGTISIYNEPFGEIMDAVIYSKNLNDETKNSRNFGLTKVVERVDEIGECGEWISSNELINPEDVIYSNSSTTTRSLSRYRFTDTNSKSDWIIVASKEASFGYDNSEKAYE